MDIQKLKGHIPDGVIAQIPDVMNRFQLNTPERLSHFLSQCSHESGNFRVVNENLNYNVKGLQATFPKFFVSADQASQYAMKPDKIANHVYASRMGNGDEASGDGWKFKGRGFIQLTGKNNYVEFGKAIGEDVTVNPDVVAVKYPLLSAAWFFSKNCLKKADTGATDESVTLVTRCVNGGILGLNERLAKFKEYYQLLK